MAVKIHNKGEKFECPHCFAEQESPIEDYVIYGRVGPASIGSPEQCGDCDKHFEVEALLDGTFKLTECDDEDEEEDGN